MQKTIMVIGGGLLQLPVILTGKKMGLRIIVTDYNAEAIGMKYADIPIVMSTRDIEGTVRVAKVQNGLTPINAVLTVGTDASMTVSAVANTLNLPGIKFEDAEAATNKIKMRMRFKEHNVPSPSFLPVWSLSDAKKACRILGFPVVIKPSDNMGARGVRRVDTMAELADAFQFSKSASPSGDIIIEEFMEGPELSIDAIVYNNEIFFSGIADRIITHPPYFIEIGHNMPSALPASVLEDACDVMRQGIRALGITIGAAKGDIKITGKGAMIGELAARLSGGFMSACTYPLSSGVDLMRAAIEVALGQEPANLDPLFNRVSIERAIIPKPGTVKKITGLEDALKIPGISEIFLNVKEGDQVKVPRSNVEKAGHVIVTANSLPEAETAFNKCMDVLKIEIAEQTELSIESINLAAKEKFRKICYVCKDCNGVTCASGVPGMGGVDTGASFRRNSEALKKYKIATHLIHEVTEPDTSSSFLGIPLSLPVMAAPITGTVTNMAGAIDELEYNRGIVAGCTTAGSLAFVGDGATPEKYRIGLQAIQEYNGMGVAIFKPRSDDSEIIKRIRAAEDAGALAVGMDIDAVVFKTMAMKNQSVGPKSLSALKELISSTKLPFILKGIMTPHDAELAVKAGARGIIVSNHGGRVLDEMAGSMDVLEDIVDAVKGQTIIMVDGGFRKGVDVLKALAVGAELVLIGRPVAIACVGAGADGTAFYLKTIQTELKKAMILTGCQTLSDINRSLVMRLD